MSANAVKFPGLTKAEVPAEDVLQGALEADLEIVIVLGETKDGELYAAGSVADGPLNAWLAQKFILFLHQQV